MTTIDNNSIRHESNEAHREKRTQMYCVVCEKADYLGSHNKGMLPIGTTYIALRNEVFDDLLTIQPKVIETYRTYIVCQGCMDRISKYNKKEIKNKIS